MQTMQRLQNWNASSDPQFGKRRIWAFDLDDTLTERGVVPASVLEQLEALQAKGHLVVMVTGRPSAWALPFAKVLPFDAVVAENGASMCFWPASKVARVAGEEPCSLFWTSQGYLESGEFLKSSARGESDSLKAKVKAEVFAKFPQMKIASDQLYRLYDLAIDFAEAVQPARSLAEAQAVKKIFESHGAIAKVSSIHVNGWWGTFDKALGLETLLGKVQWTLSRGDLVYFGDSPNDAPLFAWAPLSVGVANLKNFDADKSWRRPTYIAGQDSGRGVIESISHYLKKESA